MHFPAKGIEAAEMPIQICVGLDHVCGKGEAPRLRVVRIGGEHSCVDQSATAPIGDPRVPKIEGFACVGAGEITQHTGSLVVPRAFERFRPGVVP
jgi:hypothetical protein